MNHKVLLYLNQQSLDINYSQFNILRTITNTTGMRRNFTIKEQTNDK